MDAWVVGDVAPMEVEEEVEVVEVVEWWCGVGRRGSHLRLADRDQQDAE